MDQPLQSAPAPELIFGIVAPIGVDLDLLTEQITEALREMQYDTQLLRLTELMRTAFRNAGDEAESAGGPYIQSIQSRIAKANSWRNKYGDDVLAVLAISAIRRLRQEYWRSNIDKKSPLSSDDIENTERMLEEPIPSQAYVIRQFKRPEEIALFRSVYGKQFVLISATAPEDVRLKRIEDEESRSCGGLISNVELNNRAFSLISQDSKESLEPHGQDVRDAFPRGDVFIDTSNPDICSYTIRRVVRALFGHNEITPTHDEYGMYLAKTASLRSSDLSRQVGAAVFRDSGEVATLGCNEVPKFGGGTYWAGDAIDHRDFVDGYDPNEKRKVELIVDIINRLQKNGQLTSRVAGIGDAYAITRELLTDKSDDGIKKSKIMDIIEFGRIIHAEMSAICDASRLGVSLKNGTLYCTTFPCHICAKHIVAAGIRRVVYLEPYPKSYAKDLHSDSISVDNSSVSDRVRFEAFIGVSPFRYRDIFEKGKRKYATGMAQRWAMDAPKPVIDVYFPSYAQAEVAVVGECEAKLQSDGVSKDG